ncbi:uncharacterized protein LOC125368861 [Ricinus communis]|uniref:uncharacterized protein LOC125368861 n=1 Tax=Ricinus communis TaxID=3988 RepID=UPI00201AAD35|nr:uncharacterized protein LOC125368861 [Ricinus communis]
MRCQRALGCEDALPARALGCEDALPARALGCEDALPTGPRLRGFSPTGPMGALPRQWLAGTRGFLANWPDGRAGSPAVAAWPARIVVNGPDGRAASAIGGWHARIPRQLARRARWLASSGCLACEDSRQRARWARLFGKGGRAREDSSPTGQTGALARQQWLPGVRGFSPTGPMGALPRQLGGCHARIPRQLARRARWQWLPGVRGFSPPGPMGALPRQWGAGRRGFYANRPVHARIPIIYGADGRWHARISRLRARQDFSATQQTGPSGFFGDAADGPVRIYRRRSTGPSGFFGDAVRIFSG